MNAANDYSTLGEEVDPGEYKVIHIGAGLPPMVFPVTTEGGQRVREQLRSGTVQVKGKGEKVSRVVQELENPFPPGCTGY